MTKLDKLENKLQVFELLEGKCETTKACTRCESGTLCLDDTVMLTSSPPKYRWTCNKCSHIEYITFGG